MRNSHTIFCTFFSPSNFQWNKCFSYFFSLRKCVWNALTCSYSNVNYESVCQIFVTLFVNYSHFSFRLCVIFLGWSINSPLNAFYWNIWRQYIMYFEFSSTWWKFFTLAKLEEFGRRVFHLKNIFTSFEYGCLGQKLISIDINRR